MPVVMNMRWENVTPAQYEAARGAVAWERDVPPGAMYHVAAFDEEGIVVTDVWESAEQLDDFVVKRLMPGARQVGIAGEPDVTVRPAHNLFAPAYDVRLPDRDEEASGASRA